MINVGIIGFGSAGKRHYENCLTLGHSAEVQSLHKKSKFQQKKYDLIIIASKTKDHYKDALRFRDYSDTFMFEKPLAMNSAEAKKIKKMLKNKSAFVGYTMIFHPMINELKKILTTNKFGDIHLVQIHCGSYLPSWRTSDYTKNYSANKKLGGGVLRELIHETNYAQFLFPDPIKKISGYWAKISHLKIRSEDMGLLVFIQKNKNIVITLNYFQRLPERYIKIHAEKGTIFCDLINKDLKIFDENNKPTYNKKFEFERNDTFINELKFATLVSARKEKIPSILSLDQAIRDLGIIEKIKKI
ncbi:MAG TPA: Gfo/Idh/MocA family oxidoreductase [Candidatus Paceibacterota bacterium]